MKTFFRIAAAAALFAAMTACDAFHSLTKSRLKTAQGSPYELIVVCPQQEWTGELGDTLRSILTAPVPYLNQTEPLFDVLRVTERGFSGMVADHRNILKIVEDPSLAATNIAVQYDVTAEPQIVLTLQGPDDKALTDYLSEHRESLVQVLEKAERDRAVKFAEAFSEQRVAKAIKSTFGVDMTVPKGYVLAADEKDFLWARYEYPTASQGFFIYSYPYRGQGVALAGRPARGAQQIRRPHSRPVGRFVHDHLRSVRTRLPHVPHGGTPVVRAARFLGCPRRLHGRPVRQLHDRRHGHRPRPDASTATSTRPKTTSATTCAAWSTCSTC